MNTRISGFLATAVLLLGVVAPYSEAATIIVDSADGSFAVGPGMDAVCSINEAIHNANENNVTYPDCAGGESGLDTILLANDVTLVAKADTTLGFNGTFSITSEIILDGQGHSLSRDTAVNCNLDGVHQTGEFRLMHVAETGTLTIQNLTLENGCADVAGAGEGERGGAIYNLGHLSVDQVIIDNNKADNVGGGITSQGTIEFIRDSVLSRNHGRGGAIFNFTPDPLPVPLGEAGLIKLITNTTFLENSYINSNAPYSGIELFSGTITTLSDSTFTMNLGNVIKTNNFGTSVAKITSFVNNTISENVGGINLAFGSKVITMANNTFSDTGVGILFSDGDEINNFSNNIFTNMTGNHCVKTSGSSSPAFSANNLSDGTCDGTIEAASNVDTTLADNGCQVPGPLDCVKTHTLFDGSNAVNAGDSTHCPATDQRGEARDDGMCDIGAIEGSIASCSFYTFTTANKATATVCL